MAENLLGTTVIAQVGIIVGDIEAKARAWADIFGMPMPEIKLTDGYDVTHAQYDGRPSTARAKLAFFHFQNLDIELIEPVGEPSTWKDQLNQHGESLHHLAFKVGTVDEMMEKLPKLEAAGLKMVQRGDWAPNGRYIYLDGVEKLGAILELLPK
jgi:methylmalonyl-CoA/ethylmalonyl-CoA epimerase